MENAVNRTLAIIKPGFISQAEEIKKMITDNGFRIIIEANIKLLDPEARTFYSVHKDRPFFQSLVEYMTSSDIIPMVLEKENAVEEFRKLLGATDPAKAEEGTIRAMFGENIEQNVCHGSDCDENAERECRFFFELELE